MPYNRNKFPHIARGNQRFLFLSSRTTFNIDNGAGTTVDECLCAGLPSDAEIVSARPIYTEATDTTGVASANWKLGVTAGGATIIAATALDVSKAIGAAGTEGVPLIPLLAGNSLFIRHTGIAATEAGQYWLQVILMLKP
jgi:hypothetical protein